MNKFLVSFLVALALGANVLNTVAETPPATINTATSTGNEGGSTPSPATIGRLQSHARLAQAGASLTGQIFWYMAVNGTNTVVWTEQRDNALQGITAGGIPTGTPPANFTPIPRGQLVEGWMNTLTANGGGHQLRAGAVLARSTPFRASSIRYNISDSSPGNLLRFDGTFSGLSVSRIGMGTDGAVHNSGDPLITKITMAGVASAFVAVDTATSDAIRKFIADNRPLSLTATYTLDGESVSESVAFNTADATPPTLSIVKGQGSLYVIIRGTAGIYWIQRSDTIPVSWDDFKLVNVDASESSSIQLSPVSNKAIYRAKMVQ